MTHLINDGLIPSQGIYSIQKWPKGCLMQPSSGEHQMLHVFKIKKITITCNTCVMQRTLVVLLIFNLCGVIHWWLCKNCSHSDPKSTFWHSKLAYEQQLKLASFIVFICLCFVCLFVSNT